MTADRRVVLEGLQFVLADGVVQIRPIDPTRQMLVKDCQIIGFHQDICIAFGDIPGTTFADDWRDPQAGGQA